MEGQDVNRSVCSYQTNNGNRIHNIGNEFRKAQIIIATMIRVAGSLYLKIALCKLTRLNCTWYKYSSWHETRDRMKVNIRILLTGIKRLYVQLMGINSSIILLIPKRRV